MFFMHSCTYVSICINHICIICTTHVSQGAFIFYAFKLVFIEGLFINDIMWNKKKNIKNDPKPPSLLVTYWCLKKAYQTGTLNLRKICLHGNLGDQSMLRALRCIPLAFCSYKLIILAAHRNNAPFISDLGCYFNANPYIYGFATLYSLQ